MKKYYLAPLCSAFVVPGMGQVINRHLKKGLTLMGIVFLLLVAAAIEFFKMIQPLPDLLPSPDPGLSDLVDQMRIQDFSRLRLILILSFAIWLYSIIDALIYGIKSEKKNK
jgi:TM2 domain-containing membrane protein YozV